MLRIWGRRNSINVQKAMWAVAELGLEHERIDAGGQFGGLASDEYVQMNPNRRVPTIDDGGVVVWESHAIVRYLAAKYGAGTLWPEDCGTRARSDMWMDWTTADLQPAFIGGVFWNFYRTPEPQRNWNAIRQGIARSAILFRLLDTQLRGQGFPRGPGTHDRRHCGGRAALSLLRARNRSPRTAECRSLVCAAKRSSCISRTCHGAV